MDFHNLLKNIGSIDNSVRENAEKELSLACSQNPNSVVSAFVNLLSSDDVSIKTISAVAFKRLLVLRQIQWKSVDNATKDFCKQSVLHLMEREQNLSVRRKIADLVSEIYVFSKKAHDGWLQLIELLVHKINLAIQGSSDDIEVVCRMLQYTPGLVQEIQGNHLSCFFQKVFGHVNDSSRIEVLKSFVGAFSECDTKTRKDLYSCLEYLAPSLNLYRDESLLQEAVSVITELLPSYKKPAKMMYPSLIHSMVNLLEAHTEDETKIAALEAVNTLAEVVPTSVQGDGFFFQQVIPSILKLFTRIEDSEDWYMIQTFEEDDSYNTIESHAQMSLDRLAQSLDPGTFLSSLSSFVSSMIQSNSWKERYGGLMTIFSIAEGCRDLLSSQLEAILKLVLMCVHDEHPRVRYAVTNALGQMCTDFEEELQRHHFEHVADALFVLLNDTFPRVYTQAAAALINLMDGSSKEQLVPFSEKVVKRLLVILQTGKPFSQETALEAIATLAEKIEGHFTVFFGGLSPMLFSFLNQCGSKETRVLKAKILDCISLIALAVGKDVFSPFVQEYVQVVLAIQNTVHESDDPVLVHLNVIWARLCRLLKEDFGQLLGHIMPSLLTLASVEPDVIVATDDEEQEGYEYFEHDRKRIGIKTSVNEEKESAIHLIHCFSGELKEGFAAHVPNCLQAILPSLQFHYHEGVMTASARILHSLLSCLPENERSLVLPSVWNALLESLRSAVEPEFLCAGLETCGEFLDSKFSFDEGILRGIFETLVVILKDCHERLLEKQALTEDDERGWEEDEEFDLNEQDVRSSVAQLLHSLFSLYCAVSVPLFDEILVPFLVKLASVPQWNHFFILLGDDLIEFLGPNSLNYQHLFLSFIVQGIMDASPDIRQASCYGIGMAALRGGSSFQQVCQSSLSLLHQVVCHPDSRKDPNILATDNAVSAIGKILSVFDPSNNSSFLEWIHFLPIVSDEEEYESVFSILGPRLDVIVSIAPQDLLNHLALVYAKAILDETCPHHLLEHLLSNLHRSILGRVGENWKLQWSASQLQKLGIN